MDFGGHTIHAYLCELLFSCVALATTVLGMLDDTVSIEGNLNPIGHVSTTSDLAILQCNSTTCVSSLST